MFRRTGLALALVLVCGACDAITEVGRELTLSLSTDRQNIRAGQGFEIRYAATGSSLIRIAVDPGDASGTQLVALSGSQTASGYLNHSYGQAGTYDVEAEVLEFDGRSHTARMTVVIAQ